MATGAGGPPGLRRDARLRSAPATTRAPALPPYSAVQDEPDRRAPCHHAGRDVARRRAGPGILDLVIMGDSALRQQHCTLTDLIIVARQRRRGAPLLRIVLPMLDPRSESPWESIMRVLHRAADIPVLVQEDVHDQFGRFLGRADLLIEGTRRLQEYDGEGHRDGDQHGDDLARDRELLGEQLAATRLCGKGPTARRCGDHLQCRPDARTRLGRPPACRLATPGQALALQSGRPRPCSAPVAAGLATQNRSPATGQRL